MKTQALVKSLCFVEVKRHDTPLLASNAYRPDAWSPSLDLSGGVAQVQSTVQGALEDFGRRIMPADATGNPSGEVLFNIQPRSFLVVGSLGEFVSERGGNESRFRSFELQIAFCKLMWVSRGKFRTKKKVGYR